MRERAGGADHDKEFAYRNENYTEFKNPTFFPTTRQLLSRASFEFIDLDTNTLPSFNQQGKSTVIQIVVKRQAKRMKHPFQIHLDSSCKISKEFFPTNNNMEFTVQLPKRLVFKKNWSVTLKSISFAKRCFFGFKRKLQTSSLQNG